MTDLEMIKKCTEAMGMAKAGTAIDHGFLQVLGPYNPLTDDAQAMALVKKFKLHITPWDAGMWYVELGDKSHDDYLKAFAYNLNRAIVECVAKMGEPK